MEKEVKSSREYKEKIVGEQEQGQQQEEYRGTSRQSSKEFKMKKSRGEQEVIAAGNAKRRRVDGNKK